MVPAAGSHSPISGIVIQLGGFQLLLSFMGSIGAIMAGSGLEEKWKTVLCEEHWPGLIGLDDNLFRGV